jgi:DNA-binding transcriptional MocR family regulator
MYAQRCASLIESVERHLGHEARTRRPVGGHHLWITFRQPIDERALLTEAVRCGTTFIPGGVMTAEPSGTTSIRLSYSRLDEPQLEEAVRRLAQAVRTVRARASRPGLAALS